jgi:hypothetical protein
VGGRKIDRARMMVKEERHCYSQMKSDEFYDAKLKKLGNCKTDDIVIMKRNAKEREHRKLIRREKNDESYAKLEKWIVLDGGVGRKNEK